MLVNKLTNNAPIVYAMPSESYGSFTAGKHYRFEHVRNGLYQTISDDGHLKYDSLTGDKSAHLWNSRDWDLAGHFILLWCGVTT